MSEKVRYDNIDVARGLAMLVIIQWHVVGMHTTRTDGWVMPIFFIIMGVFYKQESSFKVMAIKKLNTIVIPMAFFSVPMFIISIFEKGFMTTLLKVANPYSMIHGVSWFFICTLWCYVINYILHKYIHNSKLLFLAMIVLSAVSYYITSTYSFHGHKLVLPLFCSTALTAMGYLAIGEFVRKYFLYRVDSILLIITGLCIVVIIPSGIQDNYWNHYEDNWLKLLLVGAIESLALIQFCSYLPKQLAIIGKFSLLILLIHPYIVLAISPLHLNIWLSYGIVTLTTILVSFLLFKYLPQICGFKPLIKLS